MEQFVEFLSGFNAQTLLSMTLILWYFVHEMKSQFNKQIEEIRKEYRDQSARTDKLYEMFIGLLSEMRK